MDLIGRLAAAVDYVEQNLEKDISARRAGEAACMSPFHFQRTFSVITGVSFAEYVRRRRLTLAAREIAEGRAILETALKYGWESQAAFTRSFKVLHGITPGAVREDGVTISAWPPFSFQINIQGAKSMDYEIRKMDGFRVAGMQRVFTNVDGANFRDIPKFWDEVMEDGSFGKMMSGSGSNNFAGGGSLGICFDTDGGEGEFDYMIGMVPDGDAVGSAGLTAREIPAQTWAVFRGDEPLPEGIQKIWKAVYAEWFPATEYEHAAGPELELYLDPDRNGGKMVYEVWIPVRKG